MLMENCVAGTINFKNGNAYMGGIGVVKEIFGVCILSYATINR